MENEFPDVRVCAECGGLEGRIQHVDIAWPSSWPSGRYVDVELWLHPECEAACIERLEGEMKGQEPQK